jgi:hypothetical protein
MQRIINPMFIMTTELLSDGRKAVAFEVLGEDGNKVELVFTKATGFDLVKEMMQFGGHVKNVLDAHSYDEAMEILGLQDAERVEPMTIEDLDA